MALERKEDILKIVNPRKEEVLKVVNHRKNGEEFDPSGFVLPYEVTKTLVETFGLSDFVSGSPAANERRC